MAALSPSASAAPGDPNSLQVVGQELFIFAPSGASNDTLFFTEPTPAADKPNVRPSFTPPGGNVSAQCVSDGVGGFNCTGVGNTALTAIHVFMGDGNDFVDWCCNGQGFSIKTDIDFGPGDDTALGDLVDDNPANLPQKGFEINGEAGRDFIVGTGTASGLPGDLLTGGEGDDTLISFPGDDTAHGGPGNDNLTGEQGVDVLNGEAGADTLNGGTENDTLSGGEGRDVISPGDGNDDISGDAGFDQVLYSDRTADEHVKVSLDDVANDGQDGETDNVRSNVEDIVGGAGNDTITGTAVANDLQGGAGNDTIEGGGGTDIFRGGTGDDNLLSRDGLPERIDCDAGADTAFSDTVDETNADCETVDASSTLDPDKDRDGFNTSPGPDCNDNDPNIKPGATDTPDDGIDQNCDGKDAQILDADNDGFTKDQDCDDNNPNARPDGTEVVGNNVDEDCDFFAAPFPIIESTVGNAIDTRGGVTKILQLFISNVPKGATVTVTCKGRGCPFRRKKTVAKKALRKVDYTRVFKKRRFRKGTRIVVQISKPGHVGRQLRITVGRSSVKKETLCLVPNQKAEQC